MLKYVDERSATFDQNAFPPDRKDCQLWIRLYIQWKLQIPALQKPVNCKLRQIRNQLFDTLSLKKHCKNR